MFGEAFSRDIESSKEGGTVLYDIMASCIAMFRAGATSCTAAYAATACCAGAASGFAGHSNSRAVQAEQQLQGSCHQLMPRLWCRSAPFVCCRRLRGRLSAAARRAAASRSC